MTYTEKDIDFSQITPVEFENLCYEIIVSYGYKKATWRQGGADSGRDIEAYLPFTSTFIDDFATKWFFECKHFKNGVPPEELNSKIAWADAEQPDFLIILTTSYITNSAKVWLEKIQSQKKYRILVIEGEEIKYRLTTIQNLIPKYFSKDKYVKLFEDIKRHSLIYNIHPSFNVLGEVIKNIPTEKYGLNDIGFLLTSFYRNYGIEEWSTSWNEWSSWLKQLPFPLFEKLKILSSQSDISPYIKDFDFLDGSGFIDDYESENKTAKSYQEYTLHLNLSNQDKWKTGSYLFVITEKKQAFEIFIESGTNFETYSYFYEEFNEEVFKSIFSKFYPIETILEIKEYCKQII